MRLKSRREMLKLSAATTGGALVSAACRRLPAADWPSWRGANRDGHCDDAQWPRDFSALRQQWSIELADSYSGPIVSKGRVYTTETIEQRDESLIALDTATGDQLWKSRWAGAMSVPFFAKANGDWIRATPATDGKHIVVCGMRDVVACFDASDGKEVWRADFVKDHGARLPAFGLVCSPLIDGGDVYVQAGGGVRKINLADGELGWEVLKDRGGTSGGAFSSPVIATIHGVRQLVVQTRTTLAGVDLESGKPLWQRDIAAFRGMNILTPVVWNDHVFTSAYGGKAQLILPKAAAGGWTTEVAWENKAEAYMSSPVVVGDHIFMHLKNNRLSCLDLRSGTEKWRTTPFGKYWSMITNGKSIVALDESGELLLIEPNTEEFSLLDRKQLSEDPSWGHVAVAGSQIFVRRQRGLDVYRWG